MTAAKKTRTIASTCKECSVRCGSLIHLDGDEIVKIAGNPAHPGSRGAFCIKGAQAPLAALHHPERPLQPRRRVGPRGSGQWADVSWDVALNEIADRWVAVKNQYGPLSLAGAVSNQYGSRGVAMSLLLRGVGSPNYMINQDLCQGCRYTASLLTGVGGKADLEHTQCILVVGKSPSDSDVVQWMQIKAAKRRGAKIIVIDPRRTPIARMADLSLPIKPGTDAAVALAMIHVMFDEALFDRAFIDDWCAGTEPLRERAATYPPAVASAIAGVSANSIAEAARLFATKKPGSLVLGHGIDAQANGVKTTMAFHALLALTGNIDIRGGNRAPKRLPGFRDDYGIINDPAFRLPRAIEEQIIGGDRFPLWSGPDAWAKTCHNPSVIDAILTNEAYPVRSLYVSGVNITCTYPGMDQTIAALRSLDCLVVATDHMTPTAELADFILPKTTLLEEEDVFSDAGGPCLSIVQRALPPRGETRTDMEIAIALYAQLRARGAIDYEVLPWTSHRAYIDYQLAATQLTYEAMREAGFAEFAYSHQDYKNTGFKTPSRKIELSSSILATHGIASLPDYKIPAYESASDGFDLILLTGIRSMAYHHSRFRDQAWARKMQNTPELRIHPTTAKRRGIGMDDWTWVDVRGGARRVYLQAWLTEDVPLNVVATGMGWWFPEIGGADHGALSFNVDAAIPYGPPWDPISGSAEARNVACRIGCADQEFVAALLGMRATAQVNA